MMNPKGLLIHLLGFIGMICMLGNTAILKAQDTTKTDTASVPQDTLWRAPNEPPDPAKVKFIDHFSEDLPKIARADFRTLVKAALDSSGFYAMPTLSVLGKDIIQSTFLDVKNKIENYKHHFVMLIFSIEMTEMETGVHVAWRYGVCQAPFGSRYWVYGDIPVQVLQQAQKIAEPFFKKFVALAKAKAPPASKKGKR
jgi:hypothetical protein